MAKLILRRLPLFSDVFPLNGMNETQFYKSFNDNAISATVAKVEVTDSGIITMGELEWYAEGVDWYMLDSQESESPKSMSLYDLSNLPVEEIKKWLVDNRDRFELKPTED